MSENTKQLTSGESAELATIMNCKYASSLKGRLFFVETELRHSSVFVTVTLRDGAGSFFYPAEARMAPAEQGLTEREAALFLLDYLDFYFAEYFQEDEDVFLPIAWDQRSFEGVTFQVQGQKRNLEREALADEWLRTASK
ncbi:MAG: hypothetical protein HYW48_10565 [Deltaproteobacteria bacterium]|nr:hypothetical protein [Deltaproteobacteria bacterium]